MPQQPKLVLQIANRVAVMIEVFASRAIISFAKCVWFML
jgi:hypothetical protein